VRQSGDGQRAQLGLRLWGARGRGGEIWLGIIPDASLSLDDQLRIPRHFDSRHCSLPQPAALKLPDAGPPLPWEEALARFARDNHVDVLSDAFDSTGLDRRSWRGRAEPLPAGTPAEQVLDRLCMPYDYTWNAEEPLLLFRRRDWYFERERQIPERLARYWQLTGRRDGVYPLSELARMAEMTDVQRVKLWRYIGVNAWETVERNRDLLLLYGALRPEQRALARSEGLTVDFFDVPQQKLLAPVIERVRPGPLDLSHSFLRLETREESGQRFATITLEFRDGERRPIRLDRRATPPADPWAVTQMPMPER